MMRTEVYALTLSLFVLARVLHAAELQPETLKAWDQHIAAVDARAAARLASDSRFLWAGEDANRLKRIRDGEILAVPLVGQGTRAIPNGLIHDWIGTVFIPNASIADVIAVRRNYDRYTEIFRPVAADAKLISREENQERFSLILSKKVLWLTIVIAGEYYSRYERIRDDRWSSISLSTRLQEVENYGQPSERRLQPDYGSGFLWRVYTLARYLERDGGVYMEAEGIVLTRDVPVYWRWLVNPIISKISRDTLLATLRQTREAVQDSSH